MHMRVFIIVSMLLLVCTAAMGDAKKFKCPPVPKQESIAIKKAGRYFSVGQKMALKGAYKKSLQRYLCSLKMKAHPNTMFNIAQVAKLIEKKKPAIRLLKKFRNRNPEHPATTEITDLIDKMAAGDYEAINTEPAEPTQPEPTKNTAPPTPEVKKAELPVEKPSPDVALIQKSRKLRIAGIVMVTCGAVFTVMGTGMTIGSARAKQNGLNATSYDDFDYYDTRHRNLGTGAVINYLLGTACLTSGIILLIKSKRLKTKASQSQAWMLSPTGIVLTF